MICAELQEELAILLKSEALTEAPSSLRVDIAAVAIMTFMNWALNPPALTTVYWERNCSKGGI